MEGISSGTDADLGWLTSDFANEKFVNPREVSGLQTITQPARGRTDLYNSRHSGFRVCGHFLYTLLKAVGMCYPEALGGELPRGQGRSGLKVACYRFSDICH